jgi:hypothetical protein
MNRLITSQHSLLTMFRWRSCFVLTALALVSVAFAQGAHAVSPAPDGGYPGGNTAEGTSSLLSRTTGTYNTAIGIYSLLSLTTGNFNTGVGAGTLFVNTADENTATGAGALLSNTTGVTNTANGAFALVSNTSGGANTAIGDRALENNTIGVGHTAVGYRALENANASAKLTANTAVGSIALTNDTSGTDNTAVGGFALEGNTIGSNNTALGQLAGSDLTTGDNNIDIGYNVLGVAGEANTIRIGNTDIADTFIRGISGATASGGAAVFVNGNGKLGTMTSSERFKDDIRPMDKASEVILALRPVSFRYKKEIDAHRIAQFGLVAEEVERVNPDLVIRDAEGKPQTVRYEQINAMLLNEFLKEHSTVQEQEATIKQLKKDFGATIAQLTARLDEQASQIHKVSARLELSKPVQSVARIGK